MHKHQSQNFRGNCPFSIAPVTKAHKVCIADPSVKCVNTRFSKIVKKERTEKIQNKKYYINA